MWVLECPVKRPFYLCVFPLFFGLQGKIKRYLKVVWPSFHFQPFWEHICSRKFYKVYRIYIWGPTFWWTSVAPFEGKSTQNSASSSWDSNNFYQEQINRIAYILGIVKFGLVWWIPSLVKTDTLQIITFFWSIHFYFICKIQLVTFFWNK